MGRSLRDIPGGMKAREDLLIQWQAEGVTLAKITEWMQNPFSRGLINAMAYHIAKDKKE